MWNKDIIVDNSKIEGKGLFVTKDIKKDELLIDYSSLNFYKLNVNELTEYQINHNWIIMIDNVICETTDTKKELDYINHSRNPNCNWFIEEKYITAARDIKAGEELTIDYRLEKRSNRTKFPEWI